MKIKKTLKKALALLLCLAAVCSFAACAPADKDETTAATSGSGENNTTAGGETEKVEITYAFGAAKRKLPTPRRFWTSTILPRTAPM